MTEPFVVKLMGDGLLIVDLIKAVVPVLAAAVGGALTFGGVRYGQRQAARQAREQLERTHELELERMKQKARTELALPVLNRVRELSEAVLKSVTNDGTGGCQDLLMVRRKRSGRARPALLMEKT